MLSLMPCGNESRHKLSIISDHLKHREVDGLFCFHQYWYMWGQSKLTVVLRVHHLILAEIFFIWEKPKHVWLKRLLEFVQSFAAKHFLLSFVAWDKNWPFFKLYEKYRMSSCTSCLIRNLDTVRLWTWLTSWDYCQSWPGSHQQIWGIFRTIRVRLPNSYTFVIIIGLI